MKSKTVILCFQFILFTCLVVLFNNCGQGFKALNLDNSFSSVEEFGTVLLATTATSDQIQLRVGDTLVVAVVVSTTNIIQSNVWQKLDAGGVYQDVAGSGAQLRITNAQVSDSGSYRARVTVYNNRQTNTRDYYSDSIQVAVSALPTSSPTATPQPPLSTPTPTATPRPSPTATPVPPTATPIPPTATPVPPTSTPLPGATVTVRNAAELASALTAARGGEVIALADGSYGALIIRGRAFSSYVTLRAVNRHRAVLGNTQILNSSYVRLDNLRISGGGTNALFVSEASHHVEIVNNDIHGPEFSRTAPSYEQVGMQFCIRMYDGSRDLLVENNILRDAVNGSAAFGVSRLVMRNNSCDWVGSDCYKFAGADNVLFEMNSGARNIYNAPDAHVDYVQGQGAVTNSIFRKNIAIMGNRSSQGLFFGGTDGHSNVLVENNVLYLGHGNGIYFNTNSTNITVRKNTVLRNPDTTEVVTNIRGPVAVKQNNIEGNRIGVSGPTGGNNFNLQVENPTMPYYINSVYQNAAKGNGVTIEDLRPVPGSVGACGSGVGAEEYICELLGM